MLDTLELVTCGRAPTTEQLGVQTDSGGERQLIVDLAADIGVELAELTPVTQARLTAVLDLGLEPDNPVDYWGERGFEVLPLVAPMLADDPHVGMVVLATNMVPDRRILFDSCAAIAAVHQATDKPCLLLGNLHSTIDRGEAAKLRAAGVPVLMGTETGLLAIEHYFAWHRHREEAAESLPAGPSRKLVTRWRATLAAGSPAPNQALKMVGDWGLETPRERAATNSDDLRQAAAEVGYPVVLKTACADVAHKSDIGGVTVGLGDAAALAAAYGVMKERLGPNVVLQQQAPGGVEIIVGIVRDENFGPMMTLGLGGVFVEVFRDAVTFLPPIGSAGVQRLLKRLKAYPLLTGARGRPPVDLDALTDAVVRLSMLAADLGDLIVEMDINPIIAAPDGVMAVDALVITDKE